MEYFKVNPQNPDLKIIKRAIDVMKSGGVIVYPTDTLYGFGVDIFNKKAMDRLYYLKGREASKPVSILVNSLVQIEQIAGDLSETEEKIAKKLFPGKVTLIIKVKKELEIPKLSHLKKLGFRIPNFKLTKLLTENMGSAVSTTSVNISSKENVENVKDIISIFGDKIDLILDAGSITSTKGSSVLDLTTEPPTLLRSGDFPRTDIVQKIGYEVSTKYNGKFLITFVCSGNICRSPMGEGILKKILKKTIFKNIIEVNSAGTLNLQHSPAHLHAVKVSEENNVDLHSHISKHLQDKIVRESNIIIVMALDHYTHLRRNYPDFKKKIILLKQWKQSKMLSNPSVSDPIGHDEKYFQNTFKEISNEIKRITPFILNEIKQYISANNIKL